MVANLADNVLTRLAGQVDVLLFNPPYVPSDESEMQGRDLSRAWAGGVDGRQVLDQLLPNVAVRLFMFLEIDRRLFQISMRNIFDPLALTVVSRSILHDCRVAESTARHRTGAQGVWLARATVVAQARQERRLDGAQVCAQLIFDTTRR